VRTCGSGAVRRDSLAAKVIEFFRRNPHEQLTTGDIAVKFNRARHLVHCAKFSHAVRCAWLAMETPAKHGTGRPTVYRAGPKLLAELQAGGSP
jgi:hypothetical protein